MPGGDTEADGDAVQGLFEYLPQFVTEGDHGGKIMVECEEDELVAAVTDKNMAAVSMCMYGIGNLFQNAVAAEMTVRVVDGLEVIHVKDGKGEGESARIGERGELTDAVLQLVSVVGTGEKVVLCLALRLLQLTCEVCVLLGEECVAEHLLTDEEEDERHG